MKTPSYQSLAVRTNAPTDAASDRIDCNAITRLREVISLIRTAGAEADLFKRAIFYGAKPLAESSSYIEDAPICVIRATDSPLIINLIHALVGIVSEAAELAEAIRSHVFGGSTLDLTNIEEELGDNQWYVALAADSLGVSLENWIQKKNIDKLRARYPHKFSEADAINRDLDKERAVLESEPSKAEIFVRGLAPKSALRQALEYAINSQSAESGSDTPDFILAEYLEGCLLAFNKATTARQRWYQGPGPAKETLTLPEAQIDARN